MTFSTPIIKAPHTDHNKFVTERIDCIFEARWLHSKYVITHLIIRVITVRYRINRTGTDITRKYRIKKMSFKDYAKNSFILSFNSCDPYCSARTLSARERPTDIEKLPQSIAVCNAADQKATGVRSDFWTQEWRGVNALMMIESNTFAWSWHCWNAVRKSRSWVLTFGPREKIVDSTKQCVIRDRPLRKIQSYQNDMVISILELWTIRCDNFHSAQSCSIHSQMMASFFSSKIFIY